MKEQVINLVGLEVKAVRGDANGDAPMYMLFSDEKTILEFIAQDPFTYHDASPDAYELCVHQDTREWKNIFENTEIFPEIEIKGWVEGE